MNKAFLAPLILALACNSETVAPLAAVQTTTSTTSTTTTTVYKDLFSQWDQTGFPGKRLPLTGKTFNQQYRDTIHLIDTGTQCICDMLAIPSPQSTLTFSTCSGTGCAGVANTYTYANVNGVLTLCEYGSPSNCTSYH
jgi:hypothetical protein